MAVDSAKTLSIPKEPKITRRFKAPRNISLTMDNCNYFDALNFRSLGSQHTVSVRKLQYE